LDYLGAATGAGAAAASWASLRRYFKSMAGLDGSIHHIQISALIHLQGRLASKLEPRLLLSQQICHVTHRSESSSNVIDQGPDIRARGAVNADMKDKSLGRQWNWDMVGIRLWSIMSHSLWLEALQKVE
jgi:hypothetical protein